MEELKMEKCRFARDVVTQFSRRYHVRTVWLWQVLEDTINCWKGQGYLMDPAEIEEFQDAIENYLAE